MNNGTKALIGIGVVFLLGVFWFFGTKNSLISARENVKMKQSQIEIALQRRHELIPSLVETVKGYASHEKEVFTNIAEARSKLIASIENGDLSNISESNNNFEAALGKLIAISESYPELKANESFRALQDELAGTANRIAVARDYHKEAVNAYNNLVQLFPSSIVASMNGFSLMPYFEADDKAYEVPTFNFD